MGYASHNERPIPNSLQLLASPSAADTARVKYRHGKIKPWFFITEINTLSNM